MSLKRVQIRNEFKQLVEGFNLGLPIFSGRGKDMREATAGYVVFFFQGGDQIAGGFGEQHKHFQAQFSLEVALPTAAGEDALEALVAPLEKAFSHNPVRTIDAAASVSYQGFDFVETAEVGLISFIMRFDVIYIEQYTGA